uniref:TFCD_C domain-containing protein n=1 Tax=Heterorhabditis bacteriophora TaxID=37862 RepID=A0A1I7X6M4_HETBA
MKDITNGLIKTCHEVYSFQLLISIIIFTYVFLQNKSVVLSNIILDHIKEYFTLLGVDSAIERFNECSQFIIEGVESGTFVIISHYLLVLFKFKYIFRNVVVLLCYFLKNVNVISYEKLRIVIEDKMPVLINVLWESGKRSEACYLAYHFMLILTSECLYLKIDKAPKIWKEKVLRKEICMRNQLTRIVVAYMPSLLTRCNHSQMNSLMTYTVKQYCAKKELATLVRCIDSNPLFIGAHDFIWNIVISSMLNVVQEDLEQCNASRDAAAWIGSLSSMFHEITDGKIEPGGQLPRSTRRLIDKFVTHGGLLTERFKKVECGFFTISVVTAFEYIPLDILDYQRKRLMKITFMLLGTIFYDKYPVVFRSALRGLARLIRLEDPHQLDFAARDLEWLDIFCKQWISTIENDKSMIDLREDMIVILAAALNCTSNGFTVG